MKTLSFTDPTPSFPDTPFPAAAGPTRRSVSRLAVCALALAFVLGTLPAAAELPLIRLRSFGWPDVRGQFPQAPVLLDGTGTLYGTTSGGGSNRAGTIYKVNRDGSAFAVLHTFGPTGERREIQGGLLLGSDGALYGTTWAGGKDNVGVVYKLQKDGSGYTEILQFRRSDGGGQRGVGELVEGDDGALYGATFGGGSQNVGCIFKLHKDGSGYALLHSFDFRIGGPDGGAPKSGLIKASDGMLYGTTSQGGASAVGTVFRMKQDGSSYAVLHSFGQTSADGNEPRAPLVEGSDGALYGTTAGGGLSGNQTLGVGHGTIFRLAKDGSGYSVLHQFTNTNGDGTNPLGGLAEGPDGALYGTASGGTNSLGTASGIIFSVRPDGTAFRIVRTIGLTEVDGGRPAAQMRLGPEGEFYGTTQESGSTAGTVFRVNPDGSGYANLVRFDLAGGDALWSTAGLLEASDGILYGVSAYGGSNTVGTVFQMKRDGSDYRILHHFPAFEGDGFRPGSALIEGSNGAIFGTTPAGGSDNLGTVFRLEKDGSGYRVLHHFQKTGGEGFSYGAPVVLGQGRGNVLYGTTATLGANNQGTVFKLNDDGTGFQVLHDFDQKSERDGSNPRGGVFEGTDGALYGTTSSGGAQLGGTVFKVNKDGTEFSILHHFLMENDGYAPQAGVIEGSDGALYGTTEGGGIHRMGTVYKLARDGSAYELLHHLSREEGGRPMTALTETREGALHGTTSLMGGTLFRLNRDGTGFAVDFRFVSDPLDLLSPSGSSPRGRLIQGRDGALYGTTSSRGESGFPGFGTVFRLLPPQTPSVQSVVWAEGTTAVRILGTAGCQYQLMRSTDLNEWTGLSTVTMPESGVATMTDSGSPGGTACYRAVWRP